MLQYARRWSRSGEEGIRRPMAPSLAEAAAHSPRAAAVEGHPGHRHTHSRSGQSGQGYHRKPKPQGEGSWPGLGGGYSRQGGVQIHSVGKEHACLGNLEKIHASDQRSRAWNPALPQTSSVPGQGLDLCVPWLLQLWNEGLKIRFLNRHNIGLLGRLTHLHAQAQRQSAARPMKVRTDITAGAAAQGRGRRQRGAASDSVCWGAGESLDNRLKIKEN